MIKLWCNIDNKLFFFFRLKGLASELGEEIDSQNDLIDNITNKAEKAELTVQKQNKDMQKILKK